jgi:uncharacterized protein YuzE
MTRKLILFISDSRNYKIAESDQEKPDIILDYAETGQIVGIEILRASANMERVNGILYEVA